VDPLEKTVTNKTKPDAVKQEVDRNEDMIRSALRAIDSLNRIKYVFLTFWIFFLLPTRFSCQQLFSSLPLI